MFKVKAIVPFTDLKEDVYRITGDEFVVDKKRLNTLLKNNQGITFVEVLEALEEEKKETKPTVKETTVKKTPTKK